MGKKKGGNKKGTPLPVGAAPPPQQQRQQPPSNPPTSQGDSFPSLGPPTAQPADSFPTLAAQQSRQPCEPRAPVGPAIVPITRASVQQNIPAMPQQTVESVPSVSQAPPVKRRYNAPERGVPQQENVEKRLETLRIKDDCIDGGMKPPEKRKNQLFPGKEGTPCLLEANHFILKNVNIPKIYQYTITIVPPWKRPYSRKDSELYREVFSEWCRICPNVKKFRTDLQKNNNYSFAFNGNNIFYSTKMMKGPIDDVPDIAINGDNAQLLFTVKDVRLADNYLINVGEEMKRFMSQGRNAVRNEAGHPQDLLNAFDVILQQSIRQNQAYRTIGRSYFHTEGQILDVGFGKEVWIGTFTSVRPFGWKKDTGGYFMTLNADVANKAATKSLHLTEESRPGANDSYIKCVLAKTSRYLDFQRGLGSREWTELERDLKGLKVRYQLPNGNKRSYKVNKLVKCPREMIIPDLKKTVEQYFKDEHKYKLKYPFMPCLHLGAITKTIYIPVEFCQMENQPLPRGKKLADDSVALMIRGTAAPPHKRREKILEGLQRNNQIYQNDPYCKEFGISFENQMAKVNGRILSPPTIQYKGDEGMVVMIKQSHPGSWRTDERHKYVNGQKVENWAVLDLAQLSDQEYNETLSAFNKIGREVGVDIGIKRENMWHQRSREDTVENDFEAIVNEYKKINAKLDLIMIIFPAKGGPIYDKVKLLGDIRFKIPTQCVLKRTLFKAGRINYQVVSNICLKINSKLGGVNHVLAPSSRPKLFKRPFMVMGADVSHASPESKGEKPSIAAVVASFDAKASNYACEIRVQDANQNEEIIPDMLDITKKLLLKFLDHTNGRKPENIVMFRDGVSEGQFLKVLSYEITQMRRACMALEPGYQPKITYLVVQKRHHTRFFAPHNSRLPTYKNGNVHAGTVVDQGINHPTEGDFYLVSHEGIQGTSRPTHYQVLWDDADRSADELEQLTYYLCHLYSRCTRSVSYPAPTYYSHLAADRARKHHNDMLERRFPNIKETLERGDVNIMYFV